MIYVLVGLSLLFIGIGFIVTKYNAKYLLSGYNTMPEEDRKKVNIEAYVSYFRRFHIFLGLSFLVIGIALNYLAGEIPVGIFIGVYPIAAYIFFISYSSGFFKTANAKNKFGVYTLVATLIGVVGIFYFGVKEDRLVVESGMLKINGMYREEISLAAIRSVELVNEAPPISTKTNGFALGSIHKGYFKTENGETIKLILNGGTPPYILIITNSGEKIYFSGKAKSTEGVYHNLRSILSDESHDQEEEN